MSRKLNGRKRGKPMETAMNIPGLRDQLDQLERLVRDAESRAALDKIETTLRSSFDTWKAAVREHDAAKRLVDEVKESVGADLQGVELEQQRLADLEKRLEVISGYLTDPVAGRALLDEARGSLERTKNDIEARVEDSEERLRRAMAVLQQASHGYRRAREEADALGVSPNLEGAPGMADLVRALPEGELLELEQSVEEVAAWFGTFGREVQLARLKVWIGRLRRIQSRTTDPEVQSRSRYLHTTLVGVSKEHQPGYIDAFRAEYSTDWDDYVAAAERMLTDAQAREAEAKSARERELAREDERRERLESARVALNELVNSGRLPHDGANELRDLVSGMPSEAFADRDILRVLRPYEALFSEGSEFRAIRRNLEKLRDPERREQQIDDESLATTRGRRAVMVGGEPREAARASIERAFEFAELEWISGSEQDALRVEPRIRNGSVDLVLLLRSFVSHSATDRLVASCKSQSVDWAVVDQGYGVVRIAEAIRTRSR